MSRMRALVLGATGHIGQAVLRELLAQGFQVTAATRQKDPPSLRGLGVTVQPGESAQSGQMEAWVRGHDLVVDCAAPYPLTMFPMAEPVAAACRRTKAILQAIHRYEARLAYVSSFTTLPRRERGLVALEAQWRRSIHPYFEVKRRIEDMLLGAANGLDITVINPTVCMGPWDGKPRQYCFLPQLVEGKVWATTNHTINVIDVRDVAKLLWRALVGPHRGVPIPVSGHNLSVRELAKRACGLAGVRTPPLVAPARVGAWTMVWAETVAAMASQSPLLPSLSALLVCDSQPREPSRLQQQLGVPIRPLEATLNDALAWYRQG